MKVEKKPVASYVFPNKSKLENNTLEQGQLKFITIFVMIAISMAMLYQVWLGSIPVYCNVGCSYVASAFASTSFSLRLFYQTTERDD